MHVFINMEDASILNVQEASKLVPKPESQPRAWDPHDFSLRKSLFNAGTKVLRWQDDVQTCSLFTLRRTRRMLKIKNILPVFVVLLFLGVASTAFAQIS